MVAKAEAHQRDEAHRKEIQTINQKLGPSWAQVSFAEGKMEGELGTARTLLRQMIEKRFGGVPEELRQRIESTNDLERLQAAIRQVYDIQHLDELSL